MPTADLTPALRLLAALPHGLIAADRRRRITLINPAAARILDLDAEGWLGQPLDALCAHCALPPPESLSEQRQVLYTSAGKLYLQALALPEASRQADLDLAILLSPEDVGHRAMSTLISTIAHEVRTPLTVIAGFSQLLLRELDGPQDGDRREMAEWIGRHARNTIDLVNNAILIAGLDAGTLSAYREPIDLRRAVEETIAPLRAQIAAAGLSLTLDIPADLPMALGDAYQLQQALRRLLDNAWRYTSAGGIVVRAFARPEAVIIEVEDSGCGIAPEALPHIFERYMRGRVVVDGPERYNNGLGLGLALCKQLVEGQGGRIGVASAPGQGSRFSIALPFAG